MLPEQKANSNPYASFMDGFHEGQAAMGDPCYGDPLTWPAWTDSFLWETGPNPSEDLEWLDSRLACTFRLPDPEPFEPTLEDWEDYSEWSDRMNMMTRDDSPTLEDYEEARRICERIEARLRD